MKLIVTGASGFLGRKLFDSFREAGNEVIGTYKTHPQLDLIKLDTNDPKAVSELFQREKPEMVIHASGIARPKVCELMPEEAFRVNVEGTRHVIDASKNIDATVIYPSSIYIFDGKKSSYDEEDVSNPVNVYGETKRQAEDIVSTLSNFIILRTDMLFGYNGESFNNGFWDVVKHAQFLGLNSNNRRQFLLVDDVGRSIKMLINGEARGVFNLASDDRVSLYDLGTKLEKQIRQEQRIFPDDRVDSIPRPSGIYIDTSKAKSYGLFLTPIEEGVRVTGENARRPGFEEALSGRPNKEF